MGDLTVTVTRDYDLGPDFELAVLSCVILNDKFLERYRPVLTHDLYRLPERSFLQQTINELFDKYKQRPGVDVIKDAVRRSVYRDRADVIQLVDGLNPVDDCKYVADRVLDWARWSVIDGVLEGYPRRDPREFAIAVDRASRTGDAITLDYSRLDGDDVADVRRRQVATPWSWLNDRMMGGPELQDFCVFLSFINVGKTTALVNVAGSAVKQGERVVYFTFEDGPVKIKRRFMQFIGRWTSEELVANYAEACRLRDLFMQQSNGGELIIKQLRSRRSTVEDAVSFVKALNEDGGKPVSVVVTDYMNRFGVPGMDKGEPRHRLRAVAEDCKYLASELDVIHYSAAQTNKTVEGKDIVSIGQVGESVGLVEGCDYAFGLGQTLDMEKTQRCKLFTAKMRDHKKHEEHILWFRTDVQRVTELGVE